jgi:hypothetical protein
MANAGTCRAASLQAFGAALRQPGWESMGPFRLLLYDSDTDRTASPVPPLPNARWWVGYRTPVFASLAVRVPVASSAASEVTWRSVRPDGVGARTVGTRENIAADIRLVGPWCSISGPLSWASTDFDMQNDSPSVRADTFAPDVCRTCGHPLSAHDAISLRWCAASELGVENRACICSGVAQAARVLAHY